MVTDNEDEKLLRRLARARTHLLLDQPWFGSLSLRLKIHVDGKVTQTIATDGTNMYANPKYLGERSDEELRALIAHEVMHCALGHPFRGKGKKHRPWNEAADIVINQKLRAHGFQLPYTQLQAEEPLYPDMSAEQVYSKRGSKPQPKGQGQGQDDGEGDEDSGCCDLMQAPEGSEASAEGSDIMSETDWQIATEQATAVAKKAGNLPAGLERDIAAARETPTDWRAVLRKFIENTVPSDYSWTQPNRRYISQGIYLPGVIKENMPRIGIAVDTSGSIDQQMLKQFANEVTQIMHETRPESIEVIYVDTKVQGMEIFTPDDPEVTLKAKGGGGTDFQPAIDHFKKDPPACMIYLTDLYASKPEEPEFPVLWAVPEWQKQDGWFGETVRLAKEE